MKKIYAIGLAFMAFATAAESQTIITAANELVLPQYAYYGDANPGPARIHYVCRLRLTGLANNTQYRYTVGMSNNSAANTSQTPGAMYTIRNTATSYGNIDGYAVSKAVGGTLLQQDVLDNTATTRYGQFTTNGSGEYTGWFACVPNGNAQHPIGGDVYFYVHLNNGAGGFVIDQNFRTESKIRLLNYSTTAGDVNGATVITGTSDVGAEKFVCLYDNTSFSGRPIYASFTENDGIDQASIWTSWYSGVNTTSGSWGAIIPNSLTGGIKGIKFFNVDGSEITLSNSPIPNTSSNGSWNGVSTANPAGGSSTPISINSIAGTLLPVKLLSFDGKTAKDGIQLVWTTTQETKNKHFEIMRAGIDGQFSAIGKVKAVSNPALTNHYEFLDSRPLNGKNSYRLKQVDEDGTSTLSKVVTIDNQKVQSKMRIALQSPNELVVAISSASASSGRIVYSDAAGRILYSKQVVLSVGENSLSIPVAQSALQMGVITFTPEKGDRMQLKLIR